VTGNGDVIGDWAGMTDVIGDWEGMTSPRLRHWG